MIIKTAGELRAFLAGVMVDIRSGFIDAEQAGAISKVAAQINQSLAVEVNTALQLQKMGKDHPVAGSMLIASGSLIPANPALEPDGKTWCDQCDKRVTDEQITDCKSTFCKVKAAVNG